MQFWASTAGISGWVLLALSTVTLIIAEVTRERDAKKNSRDTPSAPPIGGNYNTIKRLEKEKKRKKGNKKK